MVNILGLFISLNLRRKDNKILGTKGTPEKLNLLTVKTILVCDSRISA